MHLSFSSDSGKVVAGGRLQECQTSRKQVVWQKIERKKESTDRIHDLEYERTRHASSFRRKEGEPELSSILSLLAAYESSQANAINLLPPVRGPAGTLVRQSQNTAARRCK